MSHPLPPLAPELQVSRWFNTADPITLQSLRGRVVLMYAFQMLCPACISHGLPQARRVHELFAREEVAVIGLHTVFEHHAVMGPEALEAFIHEYRWPFPIGIDTPSHDSTGVPNTMRALALRGTPSAVLLDPQGRVRLHHFGMLDDMALGGVIGQLLVESPAAPPAYRKTVRSRNSAATADAGCDERGCAVNRTRAGIDTTSRLTSNLDVDEASRVDAQAGLVRGVNQRPTVSVSRQA